MKLFKYMALTTLVAFAACNNGNGTKTVTPVTGTISGTVSIEGTGASGVTVTLSSGTTATTDGSGNYTFSSVPAGAYTVSISGYPSDATFATSTAAAVISSANQTVTVNFDGSYIRTSAIIGQVKVGNTPLAGVTVSISGPSSASAQTDSTGQTAPFTGLRAGTYTVAISGVDTTNDSFTTTSQSVTLATGQLQIVSFTGTLKTTASISGTLFLDESSATPDSTYEPSLESPLKAANVPIMIEGPAIGDTMTVMTDANGAFNAQNLAAGKYTVTYKGTAADVPGNVAFEGGSYAQQTVTIATGTATTVNFPFLITQETIKVYAYLQGNMSPIPGWKIDLYDTEADAAAGGSTGKLTATQTTDSTGMAAFRFQRSADSGPNGTGPDDIVFARSNALPSALYTMTTASPVIEIHFASADSIGMSPDTLNALYNQVVVKLHAQNVGTTALAGWTVNLFANVDSTTTLRAGSTTNATGDVVYTVNRTLLNTLASDHSLPDTLWLRLAGTQAMANGHGFTEAPTAVDATAAGQYLKFIWDGTVLPSDTVNLGTETVTYTDENLVFQAHNEADDSTSSPTFTQGDNVLYVPHVQMELYKVNSNGTETSVQGPTAATAGTGVVTFTNVPVGPTYSVHARSDAATISVLNDTTISVTPAGAEQVYTDSTLAGSAGASSFAYKFNNETITGTLQSVDGVTPVVGAPVMIQATSDNIQPGVMGTDSTIVLTNASGVYSMTGLREGPYTVSVQDSTGVWSYINTLDTTSAPLSSGSVNNTDAHSGVRDVEGAAATSTANFQAYRMDTKVVGMIVNDRNDNNTLNSGDALPGVAVQLYRGSGALANDTLVATDTTDSSGQYTFSALREGTYVVAPTSPSSEDVLRALNQDTVVARPSAHNLTWGSLTPAKLPQWDYNNTAFVVGTGSVADFIHLATNTTAIGKIEDATTGKPVAGMTVSLRRCDVSVGATQPPTTGNCTTYLATQANAVTDSTGAFIFQNLEEGVYEITPNPHTAGTYTTSTPASMLYLEKGPGDTEGGPTVFKVN